MCSSKSLIIKVSSEFPPTLWGRGPTAEARLFRPCALQDPSCPR